MKIIEDNFDELFPNGCDFILDEFKVRDLNFVSDIGSFNIRINECYLIIADKFNIETCLIDEATNYFDIACEKYNPIYINGFLKYRVIHHSNIEYNEPDPNLDDVVIYDVDECPCCMEKFGANIIKKIKYKKIEVKTTKYTIKRNTFCGHPLCLDCFKRINEFDNGACPICRSYYRETGDINADIWEKEITEEMVFDMIKRRDDGILPELVDWMEVVRQSVIADGLASLTDCRCEYTMNDESMFFGVVDF